MKTAAATPFCSDLTQPETRQEPPIKYYYLYIGSGIENLDDKDWRFIVESKKLIKKGARFEGKVVARNIKAYHPLGFNYGGWTNPVDETIQGLYPCFVRVHQEWVEAAKFYDKSL